MLKYKILQNLKLSKYLSTNFSWEGSVNANEFTRLREQAHIEGCIQINTTLIFNNKQIFQLTIKTDTITLLPKCQRCLEPVEHNIKLDKNYVIAQDINQYKVIEAANEHSDYELLEIYDTMNVLDILEDELLLSLPYAVLHKYSCVEIPHEDVPRENPFAKLKKLNLQKTGEL